MSGMFNVLLGGSAGPFGSGQQAANIEQMRYWQSHMAAQQQAARGVNQLHQVMGTHVPPPLKAGVHTLTPDEVAKRQIDEAVKSVREAGIR